MRKDTEWFRLMMIKYKSEEKISEVMRRAGAQATRRKGGGFRGFETREQIREISKKGVLARGQQWKQQEEDNEQSGQV